MAKSKPKKIPPLLESFLLTMAGLLAISAIVTAIVGTIYLLVTNPAMGAALIGLIIFCIAWFCIYIDLKETQG